MGIARNVEVWIFGAFGALCLAACLSGPSEHAAPAASLNAEAGMAPEAELTGPGVEQMQPMYIVYVVGKRPSAAEKRAYRNSAG